MALWYTYLVHTCMHRCMIREGRLVGLSDLSVSLSLSPTHTHTHVLSSREDSGGNKLVRDVESYEGGDSVIM